MSQSLPPSYFEDLYQADPDPWKFATSTYEAEKYAATIAALPKPRYRSGWEIGGSIGVLTEKLATRCDALLSIDVSQTAQAQAIERCRHLPQVRFEILNFPQQQPEDAFDLIVLSEVGYYWGWEDLRRAGNLLMERLEPGGHLILVHWTRETNYPLRGSEVHDWFLEWVPTKLRSLVARQTEHYRLDLFERI